MTELIHHTADGLGGGAEMYEFLGTRHDPVLDVMKYSFEDLGSMFVTGAKAAAIGAQRACLDVRTATGCKTDNDAYRARRILLRENRCSGKQYNQERNDPKHLSPPEHC